MQFEENVPLAPYTTFRIGGPARWFAQAVSEEDLLAAVTFARERGLPLFTLGGGSNLLVSDQGFPGLVLRVALRGIEESASEAGTVFSVAAGEDWDAFVARAVARGCAGIECLSGIPGTAGGTPVQNVGAYGQEVSQTIRHVRVLDLSTLRFEEFSRERCRFAYRESLFNTTARGRYLVTRVDYALRPGGAPSLAYADLERFFAERKPAGEPTLAGVRDAILAIRARKGMLIGPDFPLSAGSFFKNPVVPASAIERIASALAIPAAQVPRYPASDGHVKLPAAWLLEQAGFPRGYAGGPAGISPLHTLALVNRGGATASDILALRDRIAAAVSSRFGISIEQEPVWVGP